MCSRRQGGALWLFLACGLLASVSGYAAPPKPPEVWMYHAWWMGDAWRSRDLTGFGRIIYFESSIKPGGKVTVQDDLTGDGAELFKTAARHNVPAEIAFTCFDRKIFSRVFSSPAARDLLVREILALIERSGARGVHLDLEVDDAGSGAARQGFRKFLRELHARLKAPDRSFSLTVFVTLAGKELLYEKADLDLFDYVVIQGYDSHSDDSAITGPVAPVDGDYPITWQKGLTRLLGAGVSRRKLLFSFPLFGYEWPAKSGNPGARVTGRGTTITLAPVDPERLPLIRTNASSQAERYGLKRDATSDAPYYAYRDRRGQWRQGWFEDARSLQSKTDFVRRERLAGIAFFVLGYDGGALEQRAVQELRRSVPAERQ
jgi:spore germination protein YaaH